MRKSPDLHMRYRLMPAERTARTRVSAVVSVLAIFSLFILAGSDPAHSVASDNQPVAASAAGSFDYVPGQILVKFKEGVGPTKRAQLQAGAGVRKALKALGPRGKKDVHLFELETGVSVDRAVKKLRSSSDVASAEPNYIRYATTIPMPNDPFFAKQWGLFNNGQTIKGVSGRVDADIDAEVAWFTSERGDSNPVTVAVIDTGIDQTHPDLQNSLWQNPGEIAGNGVDDDANGYVDDINGYNMAGISQTHINAVWNIGETNANWRGQSILGTGRPLTQVGLFVGRVGTPTSTIEIVVRDALTGSNLATASIAAGDVGTTAGVVTVTLSAPITLSAKTYYILFRATTTSATDYYQVYGNASSLASYKSDPYRGGMQHWWDGTTWSVDTDDDWFFTTNANANPQDDSGHGTHVSGIIGAKIDNAVGIAGVSYGARIMVIKAGSSNGSFRTSDIIEALYYAADNGAKVINMSFGSGATVDSEREAVLDAYGKGASLFAAAGNDGANAHNFPASYARVVSVAATTNLDTRASFSNYNASVDVSAPGENIYSTMPTYAVGLNSAGVAQHYDYLSGTSMAAPMVAGLAALVLSRNPEYTAEQVMQVIETKLVDDKGGPPAGWDQFFGTGRITGILLANEVLVGNNRIDGNWWAPAPPPSSTTTHTESLDSAGDRNDIFSIAVGEGQRIKVSLTAPAGTDFDLYLYPPGTTDASLAAGGSGSAVASSTGSTYPKALSYQPPAGAGGTYYLRVNAASGRGSYVITYSAMDADNDIPGVPAPPSPINDALQFLFDENDVFSVSLAEGEQIMTSLIGQLNTDFDLYLYPPGSADLSSGPVATSAGSGYPEKIKYVVPAGAGGTYYLRAAFTPASSGTYALAYNIGPADVTPPITSLSTSPAVPDGDNGWFKTAPTITLASNEPGATYLQWGADWSGWWQTYSSPFAAYEGDNPLYYYSVDLSENQETTQVSSIKLDMTAPSAPTLLSVSADSATAVTLSWGAAGDPVSGVSGYRIYDGDFSVLLGSTSAVSRQLTGVTPGIQKRYYVTAVDNAGNESGPSNTATIATVPTGTDVPVTMNAVTLVFSAVLTGGGVTVAGSPDPPANQTQTGFQVNGVYYDVSSTAVYSGPITITLPYDPGFLGDPQTLRLYHYDKVLDSWIDVTTAVDTTNHTISGVVTSLSPFATGVPKRVFGGFGQPLGAGIKAFKLGQIVPVKFQLRDELGSPVADAVARIYVAKVVGGVPGVEQPGTSNVPQSGNTFRYNKVQEKYVFNLETKPPTKPLSAGVWQIRVVMDDGVSYVAMISLSSR